MPLIKFRAAEGIRADDIANEIYWIKRYAWARLEKRFSLEYCLKRHWPD